MRGFGVVCNPRFGVGGGEFGCSVGLAVEYQAVGVVPQPIERCRSQQAVSGEGLVPLGEVEVGGDDSGDLLVALGDQVVQILVGGRRSVSMTLRHLGV